ncbi:MAG: Ig-like domain-containing protein [Thermodesulfobacteriota bacterium]|nr:Ig-like domain-containing protein [Thermodesulfobacteriota bacterium]
MHKNRGKVHPLFRILLSILLVLAMAGPAAGYFEADHLIQVVYNEDDSEVGVDLGDLSTLNLSAQDLELSGPGTVGLSQFSTVSDWADLRVGYFAVNETTYQNWFATTQDTAPVIGEAQLLSFENGATQVWQKYLENEIAAGVAQVTPPSQPRTYDLVMNLNSSAPGAYAGFNADDTDGESPLGLLSSVGYVDMYLYHWDINTLDKGPDTNTDWTAVIRLNADGGTVLNPSSSQNQAPVANNDTGTTAEDTPVTINVIGNDTDADGTINGTAVSIVTDATDGTTSNNGDGTVTYTPDTGFTGTDTFTYTVDDNEGATSNEATVTVNVTGSQNQKPQASDDGATTVEDTATTINVIANDTDPDGAIDPASISIVTNPTNGTADPESDGTVEYTPTTGFTGTDTFTYTVKDDEGATSNEATATITVEAQGAITAPSVNSPQDKDEVTVVRPTLSVNNSTAGGGVVLTYDFEVYSDSEMSNLVTSDTGVAEGDGTTAWDVDVDLGENTSYYWRSRATAVTEFSPWMNLATFFVSAVNDAPSAPNISQPADGSEVDTLRPVLAVTNASDPDLDPLTYKFQIYEEDMTTLKIEEEGVAEGDGTTSWQVGEGEELDDNTAYWWRARAKDDEGAEGDWTGLVTFFVNITNDAPSAPLVVSPQHGSVVDTRTPVLEMENSIDLDLDTLTYFFEIDQVNTFDSASLEQSDGVAEGAGGTTSWDPSELQDNTTYYWRAKAWDGMADSDWTTASIFVDLGNDPPVANDDSAVTTEATAVVVDVIANDTDAEDEIAPATVTIVTDPANGAAEEEGDGTVTYTPGADFLGEDTFTYTVEDDDGAASNEATVTVLVNDKPTAPTLDGPENDAVVNMPMPTLSVNNAADSDPLTYLFEIYSDEDLLSESLVASETMEEGDDGITSWIVSVALTKSQTYYWRCLAQDSHDASSSWMETARFSIGELTLVLTIPAQAKEGDGMLQGTVTIPEAQSQDLEVSLQSDDTSEVTVPAQVTILAGETSVTFDLTIVDDSDYDGAQTVDIFASAIAAGWDIVKEEMAIGDNEKSGSKGSSGCFISTVGGISVQEPAPNSNNGFPFPLLGTILILMAAFSTWFCQIKRSSLNIRQRACFQCETR